MSKVSKEHTHNVAHNFLNIQPLFNPQKALEWSIPSDAMYVEGYLTFNTFDML